MPSPQIVVHVNRRRVEVAEPDVTGAKLLELAGFSGTAWDLLQLQGEGDPSGGTIVLATTTLTLKNGEHFRVIPGDRTFGAG
jgi:Multiubiquitin